MNKKVTDISEIHFTSQAGSYVVIVGAPFEKQTIVGPFDSFEEASHWVDTAFDEFTWIATLVSPDAPNAV